jgi:putative ABC transport system ATP-binding protein
LILATDKLSKTYRPGSAHAVQALAEVTLGIQKEKITIIRGPSGSGKTTLLCLLGTLLRPSAGKIMLEGGDITLFSDAELTRIRRDRMGFIFQAFHLIPGLPAWRNVSYPLIPHVPSEEERKKRALALLEELDLKGREMDAPEELSGGQQQRVAIARALIGGPDILLADEPTSNIDEESIVNLIQIFQKLKSSGKTIVIVSHDTRLLPCADETLMLRDGRLSES